MTRDINVRLYRSYVNFNCIVWNNFLFFLGGAYVKVTSIVKVSLVDVPAICMWLNTAA